MGKASRNIGVPEQTYYRWRREYGGTKINHFRCLKELEKENTRLKELVADISLVNTILEEATRGNFQPRRGGVSWLFTCVRSLMSRKDGRAGYLDRPGVYNITHPVS